MDLFYRDLAECLLVIRRPWETFSISCYVKTSCRRLKSLTCCQICRAHQELWRDAIAAHLLLLHDGEVERAWQGMRCEGSLSKLVVQIQEGVGSFFQTCR